MSSSDSEAAWLGLVNVNKQRITETFGKQHTFPTTRTNFRSFRDAFETLFKRHYELRPSKREALLFPHCRRIGDLAKRIDETSSDLQNLASGDTLQSLTWEALYALLMFALRARFNIEKFVHFTSELIEGFPSIHPNQQGQFPSSKKVQEPLQSIFDLLFDSYIQVYEKLRAIPTPKTFDPMSDQEFQDYCHQLHQKYAEARGLHGARFSKEAEDEERRMRVAEQPILSDQKNELDILHPGHGHRQKLRQLKALFIPQKRLGHGSFGDVDEVQEESTGAVYARKHIHLDIDKPSELIEQEVRNEVAIMQKLRHRHIATVLFFVKDDDSFSIFMLPVADWDLLKYFKHCAKENFRDGLIESIFPWFGCLLDALAYAHKEEIRHQDIKPSNILIKNNQPYLSDFGLAKDFTKTGESLSHVVRRHGTPIYWAPEIVPGNKRGRKADIFSLGCVFTEMLTVAQGTSNDAYYDHRNQGRNPGDSIRFRDCLGVAREWIDSFEKKKKTRPLILHIHDMIAEDPEERPHAKSIVRELLRHKDFFCVESDAISS